MIIDINVHLGQWPFRRLPLDSTPLLVEKLRRAGVTEAWAGSFDALLHKDLCAVNARVARECEQQGAGLLRPVGSINPKLPDWQEDLRRCREQHGMRIIRLYPAWHGYTLEDPLFTELLDAAAAHSLLVQVIVLLEDARTQHPLLQIPAVDLAPLAAVLKGRPKQPLILLDALRGVAGEALSKIAQAGEVYVDISTQEGIGGLATLIESVPFERALFGSHAPFFALESALLKLKESELGDHIDQAIQHTNAERLLASFPNGERGL